MNNIAPQVVYFHKGEILKILRESVSIAHEYSAEKLASYLTRIELKNVDYVREELFRTHDELASKIDNYFIEQKERLKNTGFNII